MNALTTDDFDLDIRLGVLVRPAAAEAAGGRSSSPVSEFACCSDNC